MQPLDWTLLQSFAAVAEQGSLSAAARKLDQSQPTIGRHVKALEAQLGVDLFTRVARGLVPTMAGLEILEHAKTMSAAAAQLHLAAEGQASDLGGTVRITASVVVSHWILPGIVADIRQQLPEIQIELVPSDATENLIFREADIAVRMYRPTQQDVIARHVADQPTAIYAAKTYLDRVGRPETMEQGLGLDFVGFDKSDLAIRVMASMGVNVDREFFAVRCDEQAVYWQLVCAGCGVGAAQRQIGDAEPRVERILPGVAPPSMPVWLVAPTALRTNLRIRRVWDLLAERLAAPRNA